VCWHYDSLIIRQFEEEFGKVRKSQNEEYMKTAMKIFIIFLAITGASTLLLQYTDIDFGNIDFFSKHGWVFLFSIAIFPRLTLLISGLFFQSILKPEIHQKITKNKLICTKKRWKISVEKLVEPN
jgi:hypothetical protein